jgi:SNF2 family DNA or RNA helicase
MSEALRVNVHGRWGRDQSFFLWGETAEQTELDAFTLKNYLFAWHLPSFYGTFIDTAERQRNVGVIVPARTALEIFCEPAGLQHVQLEYGGELARLVRLAPAVREALSAGRFMPDYAKWRAGEPGWKLQLPGEAATILEQVEGGAAWVEALIAEQASADPDAQESLARLQRMFPLARRSPALSDDSLDEEDWLSAIGWISDPTPFRAGLQLAEPEDGRAWRLSILLQDRGQRERIVPWTEDLEAGDAGRDGVPEEWAAHLGRIEKDARRWQLLLPWLGGGGAPAFPLSLSGDQAWRFLTEGSLRLIEAGYSVFLPAWWEQLKRSRPRLRAKLKSSVGGGQQSMFGLDQLLQFDWKLALGEVELDEAEFARLLSEKERLIRLRGQWVQLDPEMLEQIRKVMSRVERKGLSMREVMELHLLGGKDEEAKVVGGRSAGGDPTGSWSVRLEVELDEPAQEMIDRLTHVTTLSQHNVPEAFVGSLRPYQKDGMSWLLFLRSCGLGGCLADDMGLGKTIQWITYLLSVKERERPVAPSLLVCPTSVLGNWLKELQRFSPSLTVHLHYGTKRLRRSAFRAAAAQHDLVLTSYTLAQMDKTEFAAVEWDSICIDEAQNIKNAYTRQSAAVRSFRGRHRVALTGTPIENRLSELWSIFDFINPGYLGSLREFNHRFARAIEKEKDAAKITQMQQLIRPFLLRREKKDPAIELDLPQKNEAKVYVPLTPEQGTLYENYIQTMFGRLDMLSSMERRGMILAALTKLKQLCNHPALLLNEPVSLQTAERSNKVMRLLEMVGELRAEGDRCLIFTQFVETGHLLQRLISQSLGENVLFLHGGTPRAARDEMIARFQDESSREAGVPGSDGGTGAAETARVEVAGAAGSTGADGVAEGSEADGAEVELKMQPAGVAKSEKGAKDETSVAGTAEGAGGESEAEVEPGFTSSRVSENVREAGIAQGAGDTRGIRGAEAARGARDSRDSMENGIFILSLKAGGIGLNLTAANHVFHFDRWWNPAVENQATDRAYRIGQTRHVQVHKFVALGTLEERIDEMIAGKTALSDTVVGGGEQWITELSTDELRDLFSLRNEWIDA